MSDSAVNLDIQYALQTAGFPVDVKSIRDLSGGCIHRVCELTLADGTRVVAKTNRATSLGMFEEEAFSLKKLAATKTVMVPQPLAVISHGQSSVLLMTLIETGSARAAAETWRNFGRELAALHRADAGSRYGFEMDNHIGSTPQPNSWHNDWVEFNASNRLGFQMHTALDHGLLDASGARVIDDVIARLDKLLPRNPHPALLHGDLWSGNALLAAANRITLIDPASSIGDGWADIAMMQLFGGFPSEVFDEYAKSIDEPLTPEVAVRIEVYQLYHLLNHLNIFGSGYLAQVLSVARRLTSGRAGQ
jgi:fructosamine-3-kinase